MSLNTARALERLIHQDRTITHEEFEEIEKIVFSGDGIVERDEHVALGQVNGSVDRFENPVDEFLLGFLFNDITLERYFNHLISFGLNPAQSPQDLEKIARGGAYPPSLALVQKLTQKGDCNFEISLCVQGSLIQIDYSPDSPLSSLARFPKITALELRVALEEYRWRAQGEQKRLADILTGCFQKENSKDLLLTQIILGRHGIASNITALDLFAKPESYQSDVPLEGITEKGKNIFYSPSQLPVEKEALQNGWQSLHPATRNLLGESGLKIHLVDFDQVNRNFFNKYPESDYSQTGTCEGITYWDASPPFILLDNELDPQRTSHALVHEIGHMIFALLDKKTGASFGEKGYFPGEVGQVLRHHLRNLRSLGKLGDALSQSTVYGSTSYVEWFPEMFAIYNLGKRGRDLKRGEISLQTEDGVSVAEGLAQFRAKDPVGYLLIAKLDQYLSEGNSHPEEALTWVVNEAAEKFVRAHNGIIDDAGEKEWEKVALDFALEGIWKKASKNLDALSELMDANEAQAFFYPIRRDYLSRMRFALSKGEQSLTDEGKKIFSQDMVDFIAAYPLDSVSLDFLNWIISTDGARQYFWEDPECGPVFQSLLMGLIHQFPDEPYVVAMQAQLAINGKDYEKAANLYQRAITLTPISSITDQTALHFAQGIRWLYANCLRDMGNYEMAENYYTISQNLEQDVTIDLAKLYVKSENDEKLLQVVTSFDATDFKNLGLITQSLEGADLNRIRSNPLWKEAKQKAAEIVKNPKNRALLLQYKNDRERIRKIFGV